MRLRYFQETDTLYIELTDGEVNDTRQLDEDTTVDLDPSGRVRAIALEHAQERAGLPAFMYQVIPYEPPHAPAHRSANRAGTDAFFLEGTGSP